MLIQVIILDIAATNPSTLAQVILIDPKMGVDYSAIERLPHVVGGIVINQASASRSLNDWWVEMDHRCELFRSNGVRDFRSFNAAKPSSERLPLLFLVHDGLRSGCLRILQGCGGASAPEFEHRRQFDTHYVGLEVCLRTTAICVIDV